MQRPADARLAEADRLLTEPLLVAALSDLETGTITELLAGPPPDCPDGDRWRRERIDRVNAIRSLPTHLKGAMMAAKVEMRPRVPVA